MSTYTPSTAGLATSSSWISGQQRRRTGALTILPCLLNIAHGEVTDLDRGFGRQWDKIYRIRLPHLRRHPSEVIASWRDNFASIWPPGNQFFAPENGIKPGEIALIKLSIPGTRLPFLATGVYIDDVDDESFTYMAMAGHPIAGSMRFSAFIDEYGVLVAQAHARLRASDPLYEVGIRISGKKEDAFWRETLENLASFFYTPGVFEQYIHCVDHRLRWHEAKNLRDNAALRSMIYYLSFPLRFLRYFIQARRRKQPEHQQQ